MSAIESAPKDIQAQLNQARENLANLGNAVSELVNLSPDVFADEAIKSRLQDFQQAYEEATQRLANPSFRIATIGTTSSGKSTIVNALMGRRIAPIEAGEMSGGVLTLKHSEERKLVIESTPEAVWETGEWKNITDDDLYSRIKNAMYSYHEARRKKEYIDIAPQIQVNTSLFPANDKNLSGLPEGIGIEFLDLPGLKSIQDKDNLAIIQSLVGKSFSLVALDYMQVDEQHRQKLLGELKRVVEYLYGRTDSMIFILNRVDQKSSIDDKPLDVRLQQLKTEIQEQLNLPSLPDIIPFNARLLYYAQCAWGTNPLHTSSNVTPEVRSKLVESLLCDCANIISEKVKGDRDLRNWFRQLEDDIEDNNPIDQERIRKLLNYALKWSGGEELWALMRVKTQESFFRLVIKPIWIDLVYYYDKLSRIVQINNSFVEFESDRNIKKCIKQWEEKIKYIKMQLETLCSEKFNQVIICCYEQIIIPIYNGFEFNIPPDKIQKLLHKFISYYLSQDISLYYENLKKSINLYYLQTVNNNEFYFQREIVTNDMDSVISLENDERIFRLLCYSLNEAIKEMIRFLVPIKEQEILQEIESFKHILLNYLNNAFIFLNLEYSFPENMNFITDNNPNIELPDKVINLTDYINFIKWENTNVVNTKYEKKYQKIKKIKHDRRSSVSLFSKKPSSQSTIQEIQYFDCLILSLPRLPLSYEELNKYKNIDDIFQINWIDYRMENVEKILDNLIKEINEMFYKKLEEIKLIFEHRNNLCLDIEKNFDFLERKKSFDFSERKKSFNFNDYLKDNKHIHKFKIK